MLRLHKHICSFSSLGNLAGSWILTLPVPCSLSWFSFRLLPTNWTDLSGLTQLDWPFWLDLILIQTEFCVPHYDSIAIKVYQLIDLLSYTVLCFSQMPIHPLACAFFNSQHSSLLDLSLSHQPPVHIVRALRIYSLIMPTIFKMLFLYSSFLSFFNLSLLLSLHILFRHVISVIRSFP